LNSPQTTSSITTSALKKSQLSISSLSASSPGTTNSSSSSSSSSSHNNTTEDWMELQNLLSKKAMSATELKRSKNLMARLSAQKFKKKT